MTSGCKAVLFAFCLGLSTTFLTSSVEAALASDNAANSPYDNGWQTGDDGGTGFQPWTLATTAGAANAGHFVGSSAGNGGSPNIDTSGRAWGMYANNGALSEAIRPFDAGLAVGNVFRIRMDNGNVQNPMSQGGGTVGFGLRNSLNQDRFQLFFIGGESTYKVNDSAGSTATTIGHTTGGLQIEFTLTGANSYSVLIQRLDGGGSQTLSGTLAGTSGTSIDRFRGFNANAGSGSGSDLYFNSIEAVPEPVNVALGVFGGLAGLIVLLRRCRKSGSRTVQRSDRPTV